MMLVTGVSEAAVRALRGGAWHNDADNLRASNRNRNHVWNRNNDIGFRCCVCRRPEHAFRAEKPCRKHPGQSTLRVGRPNQHCPAVPVSSPRETHRPARRPFGAC